MTENLETAAPWVWKHAWPLLDDSATRTECIAAATPQLEAALADRALVPVGEPVWRIVEHDLPEDGWPADADLVLTAAVPAIPARPTPAQWPALLEWAAGRGWTDRALAGLLGLPETTVWMYRRRAGIPGHATRTARRAA